MKLKKILLLVVFSISSITNILLAEKKSVSRESWLEAIDTITHTLFASNKIPAGETVFFDGITNRITSGNEHSFLESRLKQYMINNNIAFFVQDSNQPFPTNSDGYVLSGLIENANISIGDETHSGYTLSLSLLKKDERIATEAATLLPNQITTQVEQTTTIVVEPSEPLLDHWGFRGSPIVVLGGGGGAVIITNTSRPHIVRPFRPRPLPIHTILQRPIHPKPNITHNKPIKPRPNISKPKKPTQIQRPKPTQIQKPIKPIRPSNTIKPPKKLVKPAKIMRVPQGTPKQMPTKSK